MIIYDSRNHQDEHGFCVASYEDDIDHLAYLIEEATGNNGTRDFAIIGTLNLWNGSCKGGILADGVTPYYAIETFLKSAQSTIDFVVRYDEDSLEFIFETRHHDGTNYFNIYDLDDEAMKKLSATTRRDLKIGMTISAHEEIEEKLEPIKYKKEIVNDVHTI